MIEEKIRVFIVEELFYDDAGTGLANDFPLLDRQVIDSLGMFQLVGYLESEFGVEIFDEELIPQNFGTISDIARLVREKE
ncbi:MAG: acyl carrier protein [Actinomycetota bacterium]